MTILATLLLILWGVSAQDHRSLIDRARQNDGAAGVTINLEIPVATVESLLRDSALIVRGVVLSSRPRLSADQTMVLTEYEVIPSRFYRGSLPPQRHPGKAKGVKVLHSGGTLVVDGLRLSTTVDAYPADEMLRAGEEVILFLAEHESEPGTYRLEGGPFGAFRIKDGDVEALTRSARNSRGDRPQKVAEFERRLESR